MVGYDKNNDKFYCKCQSEMKLIHPGESGRNVYHCPECGTVAVYWGLSNQTSWHLMKGKNEAG